jgi:hypothetical protein
MGGWEDKGSKSQPDLSRARRTIPGRMPPSMAFLRRVSNSGVMVECSNIIPVLVCLCILFLTDHLDDSATNMAEGRCQLSEYFHPTGNGQYLYQVVHPLSHGFFQLNATSLGDVGSTAPGPKRGAKWMLSDLRTDTG